MSTDRPHKPKRSSLKDMLRGSTKSARQQMQLAAFRISGALVSGSGAQQPTKVAAQSASAEEHLNVAVRTIAAVATAVWRAKTKLDSESRAKLPTELQNLPRHIQAAWDALAAGEVQVDDLTGEHYVPGMAVNILAFQPLEGIASEVVHETIKPSVYFKNMLIQRADIIVARPLRDGEKTLNDGASVDDSLPADNASPDEKGSDTHGSNHD